MKRLKCGFDPKAQQCFGPDLSGAVAPIQEEKMVGFKNRKITHERDRTNWVNAILDMSPDRSTLQYQWMVTEDIQDTMPYIEWGWDGVMPIGIYRGLATGD